MPHGNDRNKSNIRFTGGAVARLRSKPVTKRLISLDAFRGWTMFWIVGGGAIMTGLQALGHNPVIDTIVYQLNHTQWQGLRY